MRPCNPYLESPYPGLRFGACFFLWKPKSLLKPWLVLPIPLGFLFFFFVFVLAVGTKGDLALVRRPNVKFDVISLSANLISYVMYQGDGSPP